MDRLLYIAGNAAAVIGILACLVACNGQPVENGATEPDTSESAVIEKISLGELKQPVKKSSRALEGTVNTRIGTLEFEKGYPSDDTIKKLYNEMDFQRAVQAYLWGLPMVEMAEWQKAQKDIFKAGTNDFVTYLDYIQKFSIHAIKLGVSVFVTK